MRAHGQRGRQAGCLGISCLVVALLGILPHKALAQCAVAEAGHFPFGAHQLPCTREPAVRAPSTASPRENTIQPAGHLDARFERADTSSGPERQQELAHLESVRLSAINRFSDARSDAGATESSPSNRTLDTVPWADSRDWIHNPPQILKDIRNYRRQGVPIIRLVNSAQTVVAFGVSNHGKPGLYFTRKLPF